MLCDEFFSEARESPLVSDLKAPRVSSAVAINLPQAVPRPPPPCLMGETVNRRRLLLCELGTFLSEMDGGASQKALLSAGAQKTTSGVKCRFHVCGASTLWHWAFRRC